MRLQDVRDLKQEVRAAATKFGMEALGPLLDVSIGVGVGKNGKDFKLAVRLRRTGPLHFAFRERVKTLVGSAELDIITTGPVRVIGGCTGRISTVAALGVGASIGHKEALGGTLGFFARRHGSDRIGIVSNNHVIAVTDRGTADSEIVYPSHCDGNSKTVARLDPAYPRLKDPSAPSPEREVDCAFAVLNPDVEARLTASDLSSLGRDGTLLKDPATAEDQMLVRKIGRTTGRREGRIRAFDFDPLVVHKYRFGAVPFENQIEIEATETRPFSDRGDSGSLVYNADRHPVGLLFAESDGGSEAKFGLHYANRIDLVLKALNVEIAV